jgi:hypothetical protein
MWAPLNVERHLRAFGIDPLPVRRLEIGHRFELPPFQASLRDLLAEECNPGLLDVDLQAAPCDPENVETSLLAGDAFTAVLVLGARRGWHAALTLTRADRFARAICRVAGAIPDGPHFYDPFVAEWRLGGRDTPGGKPPAYLQAPEAA